MTTEKEPRRQYPNRNTNKVYYMHLRYPDPNGGKHPSNFGGITIAYREHDNDTTYEVAIARCNLSDNFCRHTGRSISLGNLRWNRYWICKVASLSSRTVLNNAIVDFVQEKLKVIWKAHHPNDELN